MAVVGAIVAFEIPAASSTQVDADLTGKWSDAGSNTPQAALFFYHNAATPGTTTGARYVGMGMTDGTTHFATATAAADAAVATDTAHYRADNAPIVEVTTGTVISGQADLTAFSSNTISLTPSNQFTFETQVFAVAFAGFTNAKVMVDTLATASGNFSKTGAGFQADVSIWMGGFGTTIDAGGTTAFANLGWATGASNQAVTTWRLQDAATSNYVWAQVSTASVLIRPDNAVATPEDECRLVSHDADGYTLNHVVTSAAAFYYGVLLLKGGANIATTTTAATSVTTFTRSCTGITPVLVLGMASWPATASETDSREDVNVTVGALTSGDQFSLSVHSYNAETLNPTTNEEYARSSTAAFMEHYTRTGADTFAALGVTTKSALADELVTLDQTDADATACLIPLLIIGNTYSAGDNNLSLVRGNLIGQSKLLGRLIW